MALIGFEPGALVTVVITGIAVLGASFLLAWAAETAEKDVPTAFAIAVLAVLAVAPEYAVDALYAWNAGTGGATTAECAQLTSQQIAAQETPIARACHHANLAIANMTGANRILIGLGWSGIALFTVYRAIRTRDPAVEDSPGVLQDAVKLDPEISTEIAFLFLATLWAFLVPLNGGIGLVDTAVLVGLYVTYIAIVIRGDVEPPQDHGGVPQYFQSWSHPWRGLVVLAMFAYAGVMIFTAVEPFAQGLEELGVAIGVPEFFMIQWIAPLASETPELIVVAVLVNKARATAGFNALISSKLNQWTLLIGTLAIVFSLGLGQFATLPFDLKQSAEIWITAAQSLFALAILINFEIEVREALLLLALFLSQVILEIVVLRIVDVANPEALSIQFLFGYTALYLILAVALLFVRRQALRTVFASALGMARTAIRGDPVPEGAD